MKIVKDLMTVITITDPHEMMDPDEEALYMKKLTEIYVGKNYQSGHIINIKQILRYSEKTLNNNTDNRCSVNIHFKVEMIVYQPGEIIHDCKLYDKILNNKLRGDSQYAGIFIDPKTTHNYQQGATIPIIVKSARYEVCKSKISVMGKLFKKYKRDTCLYKITDNLSESLLLDMKSIIDQINTYKKFLSSLDDDKKKVYDFFSKLLENKDPETILECKLMPFENIKQNSLVYINDEAIQSGHVNILSDSKNALQKDRIVEEGSANKVYKLCVTMYLLYLTNIVGFVEYYTQDTIKANKMIWQEYSPRLSSGK